MINMTDVFFPLRQSPPWGQRLLQGRLTLIPAEESGMCHQRQAIAGACQF